MKRANLLIQNAALYDAFGICTAAKTSIRISNGIVADIGTDLVPTDQEEVLDASGYCVSPAFIDTLAYAGEPGHEQEETVSSLAASALAGGFGTVALAAQAHQQFDNAETIAFLKQKGAISGISLLPIANVSVAGKGQKLAELIHLAQAGAVAFGDGDHAVTNTDLLVKALQYAQHTGLRVYHRPEDHWLAQYGLIHEGQTSTLLGLKGIPVMAETLMLKRDLDLLRHVGGKLHVSHVSTAAAVALIREAKAEGLDVTAGVSVAHLIYTDEDLATFDTNLKIQPPLRGSADRIALIKGVQDGALDCIMSQHLPCDADRKVVEFDQAAYGMVMLQTALPALLTHVPELDLGTLLHRLIAGPAKVLGLQVPEIKVGTAASLTVFNPNTVETYTEANHKSACRNSPLLNTSLKGRVLHTIHQV